MRNPRLPAWARSAVSAAALSFAVAGHVPQAVAESKHKQLFVFGDSYADLTLSDQPASNPHAPPGVHLDDWRVYPLPLQKNLGIPGILDFAVGGATTTTLPGQVDQFLSTGTVLSPRDLVTINIGGNDGIGYTLIVKDLANAPLAGQLAAANAAAQIKRLVDAGGQTFVIGAFSGLSGLPFIPDALEGVGNAFGAAYFQALQENLLPMAQAGSRFFLLDLHRLGQQVEADPARYGLVGIVCPGGGTVCGGSINSDDQKKYFMGPDGVHPTNRGFEIMAAYMANIVMAPDTIAVQPGVVESTTGGFAGSLLDRLGGARQLGSVAGIGVVDPDAPMGLGHKQRAPQTASPASKLSTFAMGTFLGGNRDERFSLAGYDYDATAGTAGIEYAFNRNLIVGLAGNYTTASADLTSGANIDIDTVQAAAYLSYATKNAFADALVAYGLHDLGLVRPGVIDPVRSDTDATALALAARAGYLFDLGQLRVGPIAGLTYIRTTVDGYTERGDPLLTFKVSEQTLDSLTGSIGLRFLAPFRAGGGVVIPYLNVTLEHQFGDDTHTMTASLTQAPLLPILSPVAAFDTRTYGRVEGGVTFQLGGDLSASIAAASTFARDEGEDYRFSAGLNVKF
jgi:outer membrane lipase/esterase